MTTQVVAKEMGAMELLGLLDTLESLILEGAKIPFSKRVVIDEERVLAVVDKIRLVAQAGGDLARASVDIERRRLPDAGNGEGSVPAEAAAIRPEAPREAAISEVLEQAYELAREIRLGADRYADEVLANLEATSARILRAIRAGRDRLKGNS